MMTSPDPVSVTIEHWMSVVSGTVVDIDGEPVSGATLLLTAGSISRPAVSNDAGFVHGTVPVAASD